MLEWNWLTYFIYLQLIICWLIKHFTVIYADANKQFLTLNLILFCREKISLSGTPISLPKIADLPIWAQENITCMTPRLTRMHCVIMWTASSEFVSSSIPSWKILTAHAQPFRGARDLAFCLKVPLDSLLVWASSGGSGETARMRRLAWTFAARIGDKYQIRLTRPMCK